jgi:hydroxymethylglutaryl-CoA lyase
MRRAPARRGYGLAVSAALPPSVEIREVGPRDGLQVEAPLAFEDRARLVSSLAAAGLRSIEVGSFVSPKAVPAMAESAAVVRAAKELGGFRVAGVALNARGASDAVAAGVDEITAGVSASEGYSRSNTNMSVAEGVEQVGRMCAIGRDAGTDVDVVISCCFGSPYEGEIAPEEVARVVRASREAGATSIGLADTTGMATPRGVDALLDLVGPDVSMHFHETRGTGLVNVYASLLRGVTRFDASVGGLGGSPFAKGAAGNVATEGLVSMLDDLGVQSGVDLPRLLESAELLRGLVDHELPSPVARSGPRIPAV